MKQTNYIKYRGKCKEMSEAAIKEDPSLTLVRGYYFDPVWNTEEPHWWTVGEDGIIYDPSAKQFPSCGLGVYTEFDGTFVCEECSKTVKENDAVIYGNYVVCSDNCAMRLVGL